jgi:RNA polymerase sigma factor (sigma-70 family)
MGHAVTDKDLLAASQRGEHAAFGQLVTKYQALVCAVSFSSTRDAALAEDVAQDAFVAAWHNLGQLRETSRFKSWLCGIARNLARKARRKSQRETLDDNIDETVVSDAASPFDRISQRETTQLVNDALRQIPTKYREVLTLYYQQDRSIHEVADILSISVDAAMQRLSRGRSYIAQHMTIVVEKSLERTRPRRDLTAGVLAAIAPFGFPLPHASPWKPTGITHTLRGTMLKIALGISAIVGITAVGYVATRASSAESPSTSSSLTTQPLTTPPPVASKIAAVAMKQASPTSGRVAPSAAIAEPATCASDILQDSTAIDDNTIEQTGLYRGVARGPTNAPITIVVFADMQCTFCGRVLATIDQLWEEYPGKLRLVVKQFPIPGHQFAQLAAEATLAANAQGKYWPFHDAAIASQDDLSRETLDKVAQQVGLDLARFAHDLDTHVFAAAVSQDAAVAKKLNVTGTPSFVINGHMFTGARPVQDFRTLIDAELGPRG